MNWIQIDKWILRSASPSGYTVERYPAYTPQGRKIQFIAYGPRHKSGAINILGTAESGPEARMMCEEAHRCRSTRQPSALAENN